MATDRIVSGLRERLRRLELAGTLVLFVRLMTAFGRIAVDRLEEAFGRALPRTRRQLARVDAVDRLLRSSAQGGATALPPVCSVDLAGVDFESSNCTNFLIDVGFADESETRPDGAAALPRSMYVKLPTDRLATRAFADAVGFWRVEAAFCERIAPRVPIRVPRVYAVAQRGARFVLLLENLGEDPGTKLFINRDTAAGASVERAKMCLTTFAELHAAFWGWTAAEREALLPARLQPHLAPGGRGLTRALNASAIAPAHAAAPDLFRTEHVDVCRLAIEKWNALADVWYAEPLTLIHGDSHLANCFEYATPDGPRMGLLDFQGVHWGIGIRDVQYHLIDSLEPDLLAAHEHELIDAYLGELRHRGIAVDGATARDQYRALAFQTLMVAVVSIGLGSLTERDATVRTVLRRSVAAIDRLGFADWLARL